MRYTDSMLGGIRILCRGGIGYPCRCGARRGAEPARHCLTLPLWCPQGGLNPRGTGYPCHCGTRRGAEPRRYRLSLPLWCPQGGLPSLSPAYPAFSLFSCPLSPRLPSPVGKGEIFLFSYARGSAPCIPGIRPFAALTEPAKQVPGGGACPPALPVRRALAAPCGGLNPRGTGYPCRCGARRGGLPSLSPANPAFNLLSCPLSPRPPSPVGKGGIKVIFMQGAPPLASPRLNPRGTYNPCQAGAKRGGFPRRWRHPAGALRLGRGTGEQCRQPRRGGTGGEGTIRRKRRRRLRWSSPPGQG